MFKKLKGILLFDTSSVGSLQSVQAQILADNRRFAMVWTLTQFFYGSYCLFMSFRDKAYALCRNVYIAVMIVSALAFLFAAVFSRKAPLLVYVAKILNDVSLLGAGLLIAWILLQNDISTITVFASVLIVPTMFVNNTLLNMIAALLDIVAAALLLKHGLPPDVYQWVISNLVIFSSMGVILGHFINKSRFERYVFAESAVQLAESNAKLAQLQTRYAYYDQMTELRNRRAFSEKSKELSENMPAYCCVIAMDINGLKASNDTLGHQAGDEVIVGTADCLRRSFVGLDTVYRIGGDEFSVILTDPKVDVGKCLKQLEKICADWKGQYVDCISISYGAASTEDFPDFNSILKTADQRMYAFKSNYYLTVGAGKA